MGRNINKLTAATAATLALLGGASGCGGSKEVTGVHASSKPSPIEKVALDPHASPAEQAHFMQVQLNAGKKITDVTVEVGYEIPVYAGHTPSNPNVVEIANPIKLRDGVFAYKSNEGDNGLRVRTFRYSGKLFPEPKSPEFPETLQPPHEAVTSLSAVYDEFPVGPSGDTTGRYYLISSNQNPGQHYNGATIGAGEPVATACTPTGGCG